MNRLFLTQGCGVAILSLALTHEAAAQEKPPSAIEARKTQVPATPVAAPYPDAAAGDGNTQQGFNPLRWAEDWRNMRDPSKRDDFLDRLKYISIGSDSVYLTLSGELRARVNYFSNPQGRDAEYQRQDSYRVFLGADLHLGKHFRAFGELARGPMDGKNIGSPSGTLSNKLLFQQAFVDGTAQIGQVDVGARVGRQVFIDGANLLLANRDNNTVQTSLTGVRVWARGSTLRADVFDLYYTTYGNGGIGDDPIDWGRRFSGVTTGIVLPKRLLGGSKLYLDPFVWRLRNRAVTWGADRAREERTYVGAHLWGDVGRFTIDWTANHQGGRYGDRSLDAWQVLLAGTYRLGKANNSPRLGLHFDYATGGGAYDNGKLRNAFAPYGNNIYYSYQGYLTPTNLVALAPSLTVSPTRTLRVTGEYQFTWRDTVSDAVYRSNGTPFTGTAGVGGRRTVDVARLQAIWSVSPRLSFTGRLEHAFAKSGLTAAGYQDSSYAALWASFRF